MRPDQGQTLVYLLAQGKGTRWTEEERLRHGRAMPGMPAYKHLLDVDGEPLIRRTARMLGEAGFDHVRTIASPELLSLSGLNERGFPLDDPGDDILEAVAQLTLANIKMFQGQDFTIVFALGDVLFSRLAVRLLAEAIDAQPQGCLCRWEPSALTGKKADEVFVLWFSAGHAPTALSRISYMLGDPRQGKSPNRPSKPWAFPFVASPEWDDAQAAYDRRGKEGLGAFSWFLTGINDYTDDVDSPIECVKFWPKMLSMALEDEG